MRTRRAGRVAERCWRPRVWPSTLRVDATSVFTSGFLASGAASMPELPDVTVYVERIQALAGGQVLEKARIASPFLVRTFDPPIEAVEGAKLANVQRLGKQIVLGFDNNLFLAIHLMIAGRLHWKQRGSKI